MPIASYKGIDIELRLQEAATGGWMANFTLVEHRGSETITTPFDSSKLWSTRELAKIEAMDAARVEIDKTR